MCGKVTECRPYGPNGEQVCFPCGMKDKEAAMRRTIEYLDLNNRDHVVHVEAEDEEVKP